MRLPEYLSYHKASAAIGDIDPSYSMLKYVADRFELNLEQRYWIAFLYAMTYCGASVFYAYNEFPDYENLNSGRLNRWWEQGGRASIICQTDARWRRSRNQFVPAIETYRKWMRGGTQAEHFALFNQPTPEERYNALYKSAKESIYTFGQFTLFLYLEALHTITPLNLCPTDLDLNQAWSCRNGLYYAYGLDHYIRDEQSPTAPEAKVETAQCWEDLKLLLAKLDTPPTVWQTETILCAYRKYHRGKRYIGYYLDRQGEEIAKMADHVPHGVCWDVLWQYREETFKKEFLAEHNGGVSAKGVKPKWKNTGVERTIAFLKDR